MKKFLIAVSVALNVLVVAGIVTNNIALQPPGPVPAAIPIAADAAPPAKKQKPFDQNQVIFDQVRDRLTTQFELFRDTRPPVVFFGDSITDGGRWTELLPGSGAVNRGIGGQTVEESLPRLDQIFALQPQKLFVMIGINDLNKKIDPTITAGHYREMFDRFDSALPNTKIFLQSVLPVYGGFIPADNAEIVMLNRVLAEEAAARGYQYVDLHSVFVDEQGRLQKRFSNDGLHLLGAGYAQWRDTIQELVFDQVPGTFH